jgi:hypothetical protein
MRCKANVSIMGLAENALCCEEMQAGQGLMNFVRHKQSSGVEALPRLRA